MQGVMDLPYKDPEKRKAQARRYRSIPHVRKKLLGYHRKYNKKYWYTYNVKRRADNWRIKLRVLKHYSKDKIQCECCGIDYPEFLTIDHIWGRGKSERRRLGITAGLTFYKSLIKRGFPPGYRVLCFNCNFASGVYKVCPHARERIMKFIEKHF